MFALAYEREHNVLLVTVSGVYTTADMDGLDLAALQFIRNNGPVHAILDFSGISALAVPATRLAQRGQLSPLCPAHKRAIIAPRSDLQEFGRTFSEHQRQAGHPAPLIVGSMQDAMQALGVGSAYAFEPLPQFAGLYARLRLTY